MIVPVVGRLFRLRVLYSQSSQIRLLIILIILVRTPAGEIGVSLHGPARNSSRHRGRATLRFGQRTTGTSLMPGRLAPHLLVKYYEHTSLFNASTPIVIHLGQFIQTLSLLHELLCNSSNLSVGSQTSQVGMTD